MYPLVACVGRVGRRTPRFWVERGEKKLFSGRILRTIAVFLALRTVSMSVKPAPLPAFGFRVRRILGAPFWFRFRSGESQGSVRALDWTTAAGNRGAKALAVAAQHSCTWPTGWLCQCDQGRAQQGEPRDDKVKPGVSGPHGSLARPKRRAPAPAAVHAHLSTSWGTGARPWASGRAAVPKCRPGWQAYS